jgi:hypothetical protein
MRSAIILTSKHSFAGYNLFAIDLTFYGDCIRCTVRNFCCGS